MPLEIGKVAVVKLSGEPVFLLREVKNWNMFWTSADTTYVCRRFVFKSNYGSFYETENFNESELATEEEFKHEQADSLQAIIMGAQHQHNNTPSGSNDPNPTNFLS